MSGQSSEHSYIDQMEWEKQLLNPDLDTKPAEAPHQDRPPFPGTDKAAAPGTFRRSRRAVLYDLIDEGGWDIAGYPLED